MALHHIERLLTFCIATHDQDMQALLLASSFTGKGATTHQTLSVNPSFLLTVWQAG